MPALFTQSIPPKAALEKVWDTADAAVSCLKPGMTLLSSGFGLCGLPETLLDSLSRHPEVDNITLVTSNAGFVFGPLLVNKQISKLVASLVDRKGPFCEKIMNGEMAVELVPMGSMVERCRAGAFGMPAFYTPAGADTALEFGDIVSQYLPDGSRMPLAQSQPRESRDFNGRKYILEHAIYADVAFVRAHKADRLGNCVFRKTAKNFSPVFAMNAKITIVEAEEIVEIGQLQPDEIELQSIFVSVVVLATKEKRLENLRLRAVDSVQKTLLQPSQMGIQDRIAKRASKEISDGQFVNLGFGIPILVANHVSKSVKHYLHSENGMIGLGPYPESMDDVDPDLINSGRECVTIKQGGSCFDSMTSFGIMRGGHLNISMLGALQVSSQGDLASFYLPSSRIMGMGGAMELLANPSKTRVVVLTEHVDKHGSSKIKSQCSLPLTGSRCVSRIITDLAVFDVDLKGKAGLTLVEMADGVRLEEILHKTEAPFELSAKLWMQLFAHASPRGSPHQFRILTPPRIQNTTRIIRHRPSKSLTHIEANLVSA